jgi:hypothetical protein
MRPHHLQITREKFTGGVAQTVECLLSKCEALSSNSSPTQRNKKRWARTPGFVGGWEESILIFELKMNV